MGGTTNSFGYTSGTNKISSATINGTSYTYTHDNTGNITIKSWGGGEYHLFYTYDYKNMLVSVNNDVTNRTVTNYYGGGGSLKVKKTDSQLGSRYYAYEGINPLCEYDSTGTVKKKYVYAFGKCIAYVDSAGNKFWLHQDALGSVKVVTNINGDTVSTYKYYPFGDSLLTRGTSKNDVQFTGKQNIAGIEAYDFSARYYDPELGRFYSIDPMGSSATSPYAYCSNNPVNRVDPTGMVDKYAGYPKGWTDFRYNRYQAWDMYSNRDRTAPDGDDLTSSGPNYGLWLGSSQSFTQHLRRIGSAEYARYAENEYISKKMFEAARVYSEAQRKLNGSKYIAEKIATKAWFNVINFTTNIYEEVVGVTWDSKWAPEIVWEEYYKYKNTSNQTYKDRLWDWLNDKSMFKELDWDKDLFSE